MNARACRTRHAARLLFATLGALALACSYDFDRFVREGAAGGGGETSTAGRGATGAGGALGGHAGNDLASGGNDAGEAGASDEAGAAGTATAGHGGGTAGGGGATNGGKPSAGAGGTTSGAGGKTTGGAGGKPSAGTGGATSSGGQAGKPSAGTGGGAGASCSGTTYAGHCYFLIGDDTPLDWPSAKSACAAKSSTTHLVTVGSADEQAMLASAFFPTTSDTWIGLSLEDTTKDPSSACKLEPTQCPFQWVTGEKLTYTDWTVRSGSDDEPNYTGACVRLQAADQTWADTGCSGKNRAICEEGE